MKYLTWQSGRQGGGYDKLLLAKSERFKFDLYLLRFPEGSSVQVHRDPSPDGYEHHRINMTLRAAEKGGVTFIEQKNASMLPMRRAIYRFRPDRLWHYMSRVEKGSVLLLSLGFLKKAGAPQQ